MPWECFIPSRVNQLLFGTPYYLDIRDAWTGNPSRRGKSPWILSRIESHALKHASWISLATEGLYQIYYKSLGNQCRKNISIIPNSITKLDVSFSLDEAKDYLPEKAVNFFYSASGLVLGYTGRMNEKALEAADFFHACKSLTDDVVSFIAAGDCREYFAKKSSYYLDCMLLGPVNYFQSRSVQLLADCLVVFLGQDYGVKPVKICEYLLADAPVLIVGSTPCGVELENLISNNQDRITWLDMRTSVSSSALILSEFFQKAVHNKKIKITSARANKRQVIESNLLEDDVFDALSRNLL
jgi:hypothetical protein